MSKASDKMDEVAEPITAYLKSIGFKKKGRTYNRQSEPGVVQVINLQMGRGDSSLEGMFTVNLGVCVVLLAAVYNLAAASFVSEPSCQISVRIGEFTPEEDLWWSLDDDVEKVVSEVLELLRSSGLPLLNRFGTKKAIIEQWIKFNEEEMQLSLRPRLDVALLLALEGRKDEASAMMKDHLKKGTHPPGHLQYVRNLAEKLDISV